MTGSCPRCWTRKLRIIGPLARQLPGGYKFTPAKDLADEIEWAKVRRMRPETYEPEREPPVPKDVFTSLWRSYEAAKARANRIDFEDMLTLAVELYESDEDAIGLVSAALRLVQRRRVPGHEPAPGGPAAAVARRSARPVRRRRPRPDDLQLHRRQQRLPDHLCGPIRRCARRAPEPELSQHAAGDRARQPADPRPRAALQPRPMDRTRTCIPHADGDAELAAIVARIQALMADGVAATEIAILVRTNAQLVPFEAALTGAGIPFTVRGMRFFARPDVRAARAALQDRCDRPPLAHRRDPVAQRSSASTRPPPPARAPRRAIGTRRWARCSPSPDRSRRSSLTRRSPTSWPSSPRRDAAEADAGRRGRHALDPPSGQGARVGRRLPARSSRRARCPIRQSASDPAALAEERRLLYVGITRARRHLVLSWAASRVGAKGSCGAGAPVTIHRRAAAERRGPPAPTAAAAGPIPIAELTEADEPLLARLIDWRRERARADGVPAYVVADNKTLAAIAARRPADEVALLGCPASVSARSRPTATGSWRSSDQADHRGAGILSTNISLVIYQLMSAAIAPGGGYKRSLRRWSMACRDDVSTRSRSDLCRP